MKVLGHALGQPPSVCEQGVTRSHSASRYPDRAAGAILAAMITSALRFGLRPVLHSIVLSGLISLLAPSAPAAAPRGKARVMPGSMADGRTRLPNGWALSPAGRQVTVGDFPLGLALSPDGRFAAVSHSGGKVLYTFVSQC